MGQKSMCVWMVDKRFCSLKILRGSSFEICHKAKVVLPFFQGVKIKYLLYILHFESISINVNSSQLSFIYISCFESWSDLVQMDCFHLLHQLHHWYKDQMVMSRQLRIPQNLNRNQLNIWGLYFYPKFHPNYYYYYYLVLLQKWLIYFKALFLKTHQ